MGKDSFILYTAQYDAISAFSREQKGELLEALFEYVINGNVPTIEDKEVSVAFAFFRIQLDGDMQRYKEKCEKNKRIAQERWESKKSERVQTDTNVNERMRTDTNANERVPNEYEYDNEYDSKDNMSASKYPYKEVIDYLNTRAGTKFKDKSKDTRSHIRARIDEGFTVDDFKKVIDGRIAAWKGDAKMNEFIRPSTLFGPKFESYLNAKPIRLKPKNTFNNFEQRDYDFAELERQLTGVI